MKDTEFWSLIEASLAAGNNDCRQQAEYLRAALIQRGREAALGFYRQLRQHIEALHTFDMCAASFLIYHAASPDLFRELRAWLVCRGQEKYKAVKKDAAAIAGFLEYEDVDTLGGDLLLNVALEAFEEIGGFDDEFWAAVGNHPEPHFEGSWPEDWTSLAMRWPVLYEKFCRQTA